jgi:hypothetical protein
VILFISSFKAILVALCAIGVVEAIAWSMGESTMVDRSNLLNAGFNESDAIHRQIIYEKLKKFGTADPDILQVGDSSGFHAVEPALLAPYLGGLSYVNLSCCANMGFDSYYDVARYMFRNSTRIKYLLLYMNIMNMPQRGMMTKSALVNPSMVGSAVTEVGAYLNPPSLSFRRRIEDYVYSLGHRLTNAKQALPPLYAVFRDHDGWVPALEPQQTEDEQTAFCSKYFRSDEAGFRTWDFLGRRVSFFETVLDKFDRLARRNGARLIVIVDPFPCRISSDWLSRRQDDAARFMKAHPDVVLYPKEILEEAPPNTFAIPIHVLPEFHNVTTERVGQVLRRALQGAAAH